MHVLHLCDHLGWQLALAAEVGWCCMDVVGLHYARWKPHTECKQCLSAGLMQTEIGYEQFNRVPPLFQHRFSMTFP